MKLSKLDMHCSLCSDDLSELCDEYTPYQTSERIPLCCIEALEELDDKRDIEQIKEYCKRFE